MTRKARVFFEKRKYKFLELELTIDGDYSPRDSEWNYSDVRHFEHVHKVFDQVILGLSNETNGSLFLQKIFFFKIPNLIYQIHETSDCHEYLGVALGIPISVITHHNLANDGENAHTITNYRIYYKSLLGYILAYAAFFATKRNYKAVIDEDAPMRRQRGALRKNQHLKFIQDEKSSIGFLDCSNIQENNIRFFGFENFEKIVSINSSDTSIYCDDIFIKVERLNDKLLIWPLICPHEGAPLNDCKKQADYINCPWHGRRLPPIFTICDLTREQEFSETYLGAKFNLKFTPNMSSDSDLHLRFFIIGI